MSNTRSQIYSQVALQHSSYALIDRLLSITHGMLAPRMTQDTYIYLHVPFTIQERVNQAT